MSLLACREAEPPVSTEPACATPGWDAYGEPDLYVGPNGEGDGSRDAPMGSIPDALAQVGAGGVVGLLEGSYPDLLDIVTSGVVLAGVCRDQVVFTPGEPTLLHRVGVLAPDVTLASLTVTGASPVAIDVIGSERVTLHDVAVRDFDGIGIHAWGGSELTITSSEITGGRCPPLTACAGLIGGSDSPVTVADLLVSDIEEIGLQFGDMAEVDHLRVERVFAGAGGFAVGLKLLNDATVTDLEMVDVDRLAFAAYDGGGTIDLRRATIRGTRSMFNAVEAAAYFEDGFTATLRDVAILDSDVSALVNLGAIEARQLVIDGAALKHPETAAIYSLGLNLTLEDASITRSGSGGIEAYGRLNLSGSTVTDVIGFGVNAHADATLTDSTITRVSRGGVRYDGIGVVAYEGGDLSLERATISETDDHGIAIRGGVLELVDVDLRDNRGAAVAAIASDLVVASGRIGPTREANERSWGGIAVFAAPTDLDDPEGTLPAGQRSIVLDGVVVEKSALAGVYLEGADAVLNGVTITATDGDALRVVDGTMQVSGGAIHGSTRAAAVLHRATGSLLETVLSDNALGVVQQECDGLPEVRTDVTDTTVCMGPPLPDVLVAPMAWSNDVDVEDAAR